MVGCSCTAREKDERSPNKNYSLRTCDHQINIVVKHGEESCLELLGEG